MLVYKEEKDERASMEPNLFPHIQGHYTIDNVTKYDNGAEYLLNITSRLGQMLSTTHLDVLCKYNAITI